MPFVDQEFYQKHADWLFKYVRYLSDYYLKTKADTGEVLGPDVGILLKNSNATPRKMEPLILSLRKATDDIDPRMIKLIASPLGAVNRIKQVAIDWADWRERLDRYEDEWAAAMEVTPDASGLTNFRYWDQVTRPLLLGIYPGDPTQRVLDAVTPYVIAHELDIDERNMQQALAQLKKDLKKGAEDLTKTGIGIAIPLAGLALFLALRR